jgi:ADP-ribosylglycohydrolase
MRLAPVPVYFRNDAARAIAFAAESSRTTHGAQTAVDACRYFAGLIIGALQGLPKQQLLAGRFHPVRGQWSCGELHPEIDEVAAGSFTPIDDMVGGGPFSLEPGFWTDDTSMALCLAESLAECAGFDATDQMQRYLRWYHDGHWSSTGSCFDIGNTTREALVSFARTGDPVSGSTSALKAGNGSLMRLAPVPVYFRNDAERAIAFAAESSRITHGAQTAVDACRYFAGLIIGALQGLPKQQLLAGRFHPVRGQWSRGELHPEIDEVAAGSFLHREPPQIRGTGFVVQSLEAALWAFARGDDFRTGALLAVNLGDDADTTGAIYG